MNVLLQRKNEKAGLAGIQGCCCTLKEHVPDYFP